MVFCIKDFAVLLDMFRRKKTDFEHRKDFAILTNCLILIYYQLKNGMGVQIVNFY